MALGCGAGGREFEPGHFQFIFDLMGRFNERGTEETRNGLTKRETVWRNSLTSALRASWRQRWIEMATFGPRSTKKELVRVRSSSYSASESLRGLSHLRLLTLWRAQAEWMICGRNLRINKNIKGVNFINFASEFHSALFDGTCILRSISLLL